ncbi:MAG: hypothetical protein QME61_02485 [Patescibacteria group bacterium]|nr:hypothetical protein [Patescibacteria group bacterium]
MKLKKIRQFLIKLPKTLAESTFLTILIFLFLALVFGGLIFYKYSFLVEKKKPEVFEKAIYFNEKAFQEVLNIWEEREKKFKQTELKEYPDLFRTLTE